MKSPALCIAAISIAALSSVSAASQLRPPRASAQASSSHIPAQPARESIEDSVTAADALLMFVSGAGILALQLRRKQKGLRTMRPRLPAN
jgi:hypothetical protein